MARKYMRVHCIELDYITWKGKLRDQPCFHVYKPYAGKYGWRVFSRKLNLIDIFQLRVWFKVGKDGVLG